MEEAWEPTAVPACAGASAGASAESKLQTPALGDGESRRGPGPVPSGSREAPGWAGLGWPASAHAPSPDTTHGVPFRAAFLTPASAASLPPLASLFSEET